MTDKADTARTPAAKAAQESAQESDQAQDRPDGPSGRPMATPDDLFARFAALGIAVETHAHAPVYTVAESRDLRGLLPGGHVKNLYLRNKKGRQWLVTCEEARSIDLKKLAKALDAGRLSFGSAERLRAALGVEPGSVTPFAVINDPEGAVTFVLDRDLLAFDVINAHPLVNDKTTAIARDDLLAFVAACGHAPHILDLNPLAPDEEG